MNFNTQQLQYLIEIERTRSVSQAASNLYMGQPNLSRVLRDLEDSVGFPIFERTRKGVRPTEKGTIFLQHARNMLREADFMEQMGPNSALPGRFRVCIPRSFCYMEKASQFLHSHIAQKQLDVIIRECHPRQALELLDGGSAEIAVIRYSCEYQDYFSEQALQRKLTLLPLSSVVYQVVLSESNPLAAGIAVSEKDLSRGIELRHRDTFYSTASSGQNQRQIYVVDRMAQFQLLRTLPNTYLWAEALPSSTLEQAGFRQLPCTDGATRYHDTLAYKPQCAMSDIEKDFLTWIQQV